MEPSLNTMTPLQFLNLRCWKLTLPNGKPGGAAGPEEIVMPQLEMYSGPYFRFNASRTGVTFIAPTNGVTTKGSRYPRSEMREMWPDGKTKAAWSSMLGTHSMEAEVSVDALPLGDKPVVVCGQIHDGGDDVCVFRVEGSTTDRGVASIWITDGDESHGYRLTDAYRLGDRFRIGFQVAGGVIRFLFNGAPVAYEQKKKVSGCFFKLGAYCQKNKPTLLPGGGVDFAAVTVYAVRVCHDSVCVGNAPGAPVVAPPAADDVGVRLAAVEAALAAHVAATDARLAALRKALA